MAAESGCWNFCLGVVVVVMRNNDSNDNVFLNGRLLYLSRKKEEGRNGYQSANNNRT